jgi:hypothetical protein
MQYKNSKKISFTAGSVKKKFSSEQLTSYSGLSVTSDFINHCGIYRGWNIFSQPPGTMQAVSVQPKYSQVSCWLRCAVFTV